MTKAKPKGTKRKNAAKVKRKTSAPKATIKPVRDKAGRRWYSDQERTTILSALKANAGDIAKTAREQEVPYLTLYCWAQGRRCPEALQLQSDYDRKLEVAIAEIAWQCVAMIPAKIDKAPLNHLTQLLDKAVEKMRLLRGESTSFDQRQTIPGTADLTKFTDEQRATFFSLLAVLRGAGSAPADGGGARELPASAGADTGREAGEALPRKVPAVLG